MKYEIENYKGQAIEYDEDCDKFICDISIEDKFKNTKRASLKDVKKEIDAFVKLNLEFKPFKCLWRYDKKDFNILNVSAIRTDGKFVVYRDGNEGYKSHASKKETQYWMQYDADVLKAKEELEQTKDAAIKRYNESLAELCEKLIPIDLSKYEFTINKDENE